MLPCISPMAALVQPAVAPQANDGVSMLPWQTVVLVASDAGSRRKVLLSNLKRVPFTKSANPLPNQCRPFRLMARNKTKY